jgi:hypothetical protein
VHLYLEARAAFTADVHLFTRAAATSLSRVVNKPFVHVLSDEAIRDLKALDLDLHVVFQAMRGRLASLAAWGRAVPLPQVIRR